MLGRKGRLNTFRTNQKKNPDCVHIMYEHYIIDSRFNYIRYYYAKEAKEAEAWRPLQLVLVKEDPGRPEQYCRHGRKHVQNHQPSASQLNSFITLSQTDSINSINSNNWFHKIWYDSKIQYVSNIYRVILSTSLHRLVLALPVTVCFRSICESTPCRINRSGRTAHRRTTTPIRQRGRLTFQNLALYSPSLYQLCPSLSFYQG